MLKLHNSTTLSRHKPSPLKQGAAHKCCITCLFGQEEKNLKDKSQPEDRRSKEGISVVRL